VRGSDVMSWNGQCPGVRDPLKLYDVNDLLAGPLCERKRRIDGEFPSPYVSGRRALDGGDARPNDNDGDGHSQRTPALPRIALSLQRGLSRRSSS
jgi:hypothetical protein